MIKSRFGTIQYPSVCFSALPDVMLTGYICPPNRAFLNRSTTGLPTPVPSTASSQHPSSSGALVTCAARSVASGYGVPSGTRSRYRSRSATSFFHATTTGSHSPFTSARSSTAMAVKSCVCPRSTPTKNRFFKAFHIR